MAVVTLVGTPRQALQNLLIAENPGMAQWPLDYITLGTPKQQLGCRTSLNIVGRAGKSVEALMSGNSTVFYNRVDMDQLTRGQHPLLVHGSTTAHGMLGALADQWGIVLDPAFVLDAPINTAGNTVTLTFLDNQSLIMQSSVTIPMIWSETIDLAGLWRTTKLNGLPLPWAYPENLATLWSVQALPGLAMPELLFSMPEMSKRWAVSDAVNTEFLATRVVDGSYSPSALVLALNTACSGAIAWQCVEHENTPYNIWGCSIVYNGPASGELAMAYSHMIKFRPNSVYFHEGVGDISIYYTAE